MRPRKIRERYLFFRDEWPFQDERILINHHICHRTCVPLFLIRERGHYLAVLRSFVCVFSFCELMTIWTSTPPSHFGRAFHLGRQNVVPSIRWLSERGVQLFEEALITHELFNLAQMLQGENSPGNVKELRVHIEQKGTTDDKRNLVV